MNRTIRVSAAGDILIMKRLLPGYQDVLPIREFLMQGEVRMANLETTISDGSCYASAYSGGTWLTADAKCLEDTLRYGFNFLGISNNHTMDYSYEGLASTISELKKKDVAYAGAGKNLYEASRPAILDTTAGQIAVIDICSTFENAARAGSQTERQPGRPGLNPLRFSEKYTITEKHAQDLAKIAEVTGINGLRDLHRQEGYGSVATSMVGEAVQHYKGNDPYSYDPEKAKELLKEAGYPDGFTTTLMYSNTTANQKKAEFYKQQLSEVGIDLELNGMESAVLNEKVQGADCAGADAEVDCYLSGWSTSTGDADWGLRPMLATESEPPMSFNISYYENEKVDQLLKDGLATADEDKRGEIYAEVQDTVWKDLPLLCIASDKNIWATSNNITGVYLLGDGSIGMRNARMAAE